MIRIRRLKTNALLLVGLIAALTVVAVNFFAVRKTCDLSDASLASMNASPQFVQSWTVHEHELVISLSQFVLWEPGEYGGDTYARVQRTIEVQADGKSLSVDPMHIGELTTILVRYDDGVAIGSHGGSLGAMIPIDFEPNSVTVGVQTVNGTCLVNTSTADDQP